VTPLVFFDCNTYIGSPLNGGLMPPQTAESLLAAMDGAGIARAIAWHITQYDGDVLTGNDLLARAIAPHERLYGGWTILPTQCGELRGPSDRGRGGLDEWLAAAAAARVRVFRAFPAAGRYLLRGEVVGDILETFTRRRIPLMLSTGRGVAWETIYNLMADFPDLTAVLCDVDLWPADRYFRPLVERYARVHLELSWYLADGGIEAFVRDYGAERMLFGSGFPESYHGSAMLALAHAEISDEDKAAIASGNLDRLLREARA
jgi:hypothetical protein